jgi:hypothetical protein
VGIQPTQMAIYRSISDIHSPIHRREIRSAPRSPILAFSPHRLRWAEAKESRASNLFSSPPKLFHNFWERPVRAPDNPAEFLTGKSRRSSLPAG